MPEKDFTKQITKLAKSADKLIQDVERDVGSIVVTLAAIKESLGNLKDKFSKPEDDE